MIREAPKQFARRYRQLRHALKAEGAHWISDRIRARLADQIRPKTVLPSVRPSDVIAADLNSTFKAQIPSIKSDEPISVNWVMSPPSHGSGGHTTIFRIIRHLEAHGYANRLYFYDPFRGDHRYYTDIVRSYYRFDGPVASVDEGMKDAHAVIATSWPTAYAVFNARCMGKRCYFVQDFEPSFYAVSTDGILAESTYRMGFHGITAGRWLAEKLRSEYDMEADHFEFGCDTSSYRPLPDRPRSGVSFYARPGTPRRGFELGVMALELFAKLRPDITLHFYGGRIGKLPFPFLNHGPVQPQQLNEIYNRCFAGLSLSLTNVSLVPYEMLAAGCLPVTNDAPHNRMVLDNPFVRYASLSPHDLAAELERVVSTSDFDTLSQAASKSVRASTWDDAGRTVDAILRRICSRQEPATHLARAY